MGSEFSLIVIAIWLKLSSSGDDCVWLTKLISKESRKHRFMIEVIYLLVLVLVVVLAYLINWIGVKSFNLMNINPDYFSIFASVSLMMYAIFYLRNKTDDDDTINSKKALFPKIIETIHISVIGSVDELLTFILMFSTNKISFYHLMIGTLIAGVMIILFSEGLKRIKIVLDILEKLAIWKIIFAFGFAGFILAIYNIISRV